MYPIHHTISQHLISDTTLFSILAHDNDDGDNLQLTVGDQQTREYFKVHNDSTGNNVTFHIELIKSLDRETVNTMFLSFWTRESKHITVLNNMRYFYVLIYFFEYITSPEQISRIL